MSEEPRPVRFLSPHWDGEEGVMVPVALDYLKGVPISTTTLTPREALIMAEDLTRAAVVALDRIDYNANTDD